MFQVVAAILSSRCQFCWHGFPLQFKLVHSSYSKAVSITMSAWFWWFPVFYGGFSTFILHLRLGFLSLGNPCCDPTKITIESGTHNMIKPPSKPVELWGFGATEIASMYHQQHAFVTIDKGRNKNNMKDGNPYPSNAPHVTPSQLSLQFSSLLSTRMAQS
jgi:hypothetical protein